MNDNSLLPTQPATPIQQQDDQKTDDQNTVLAGGVSTAVNSTSPVTPTPLPETDALALLEQAINEASAKSDEARKAAEEAMQQAVKETGELAQVMPQAILNATNTLNPATPTTTAKESLGSKTPDNSSQAESGTGIQAVEIEKNPELPPEVEGYLNKVEQQADQLPKEIVIVDAIKNLPQNHPLPKQAVVVVPITPAIEEAGAKKSPKFSVRWLVEWSHKIMKMFVGKVIYRKLDS